MFLLNNIIFTGHVNTQCQDGWLYGNKHCYFFSDEILYWRDARDKCQEQNAKIVTIETFEEKVSLFILVLFALSNCNIALICTYFITRLSVM